MSDGAGLMYQVQIQLTEAISQLKDAVRRIEKVEKDLDNKYTTKEYVEDHDRRLASLEDTLKWINRTIIGVVITGVLGLLIVVKRGG